MSETRRITLQFPSLRAFLAGYGERISLEGMLLRGESPPDQGTTIEVEVVVAEGMRLLRARGEVLWSEPSPSAGRLETAAVRFDELDEASRTLISKIVDQRRRDGAEVFSLAAAAGRREARPRDLTVPAAADSGTGGESTANSVFDLGGPPPATGGDLFAPAPPAAAEPAAPARRPPPPVPLLADADPEPPVGEGPVQSDLSELFGGDESAGAPARGRTQAFPPSFVDEVEAELEAAGSAGGAESDPEMVAPGAPPEADVPLPETAPSVRVEPPAAAAPEPPAGEPAPEGPTGEGVAPPPETAAETAPPPPEPAAGLEDEPAEVAAAPLVEGPPPPVPVEKQPPPPAVEEQAPSPAIEESPPAPPIAEPPPAEREAPAAAGEAGDTEPPTGRPAPIAGAAVREAGRVLDGARGPETVEIPLAKAGPEGGSEPAPAPAARPPAAPPAEPPEPASTGTAAMDDNLLTIPELSGDSPAAPPSDVRRAPEQLPTSAASLRGAASSSRHLGTWILIALLIAALGVAGYLLLRMVRGGGEPLPQAPPASAPSPAPAGAAADVGGGSEPVVEEPATAGAEEPAGAAAAEPAAGDPATRAAAAAPSGPPPPIEAASPVPASSFTALERITWTESGGQTVLALVGDGEISRRQVELVPIGGDQPRLVIKISGVSRPFQPAVLEVGTAQVRRIRTGLHAGGELHVVVDLAAAGISVSDLSEQGPRLEVRLGRP